MNYFLPEKQAAKFAFIYIYKDKRCNTSQIDICLLIVENIYIHKAHGNPLYSSSTSSQVVLILSDGSLPDPQQCSITLYYLEFFLFVKSAFFIEKFN